MRIRRRNLRAQIFLHLGGERRGGEAVTRDRKETPDAVGGETPNNPLSLPAEIAEILKARHSQYLAAHVREVSRRLAILPSANRKQVNEKGDEP